MSVNDFKKLQKDETLYYEILCYAIPFTIFVIVLVLLAIDSNNYVNPWIFLIPIAYPLVFFGVYERKYLRYKKGSTSGFYFKGLNYDKAVIRYSFLEKIFRNFIVFLIIIGILAAIGITFTLKSVNESVAFYTASDIQYHSELNKILNMDPDELRKYFEDSAANMTQYGVEQNLLNIVTTEIKQNFTNYNSNSTSQTQIIIDLETGKIKQMDEVQQRELLRQKIYEMPFNDLKQIMISNIENTKPNAYFLSANNNISKTIEVLFLYVYIPGMLAYTVFLSKRSITSRKDFHYHFTIGCFAIVSGYSDLEDMEKRRYVKLGITHYDKFINKNLNLRIKNLDVIYSRLLVNDPASLTNLSHNLENVLATQHTLKLLDSLKKPEDDNSEILITDSYLNKLKERSWIIISVVSTISTIVSILTKL